MLFRETVAVYFENTQMQCVENREFFVILNYEVFIITNVLLRINGSQERSSSGFKTVNTSSDGTEF
jgi:hypothetical protein